MAAVLVIGAGLAGLSTAARLAKLGHSVVVCERGDSPGGLLRRVGAEGFTWDVTPFQTTVPAVLRDLFRKSGRPLERYVDLELTTPARRQVFPDGTQIDLPTGSRAAQREAVDTSLGAGNGGAWEAFVDGQGDVWDLLRARVLDDRQGSVALADRKLSRALRVKVALDRLLRKAFDDPRLRLMASYSALRFESRPTDEPALRAVETYVERTFGVWRAPGGCLDMTTALLTRMAERSVDVRFGAEVVGLQVSGDRVTAAQLADGRHLAADIIVTAVSPGTATGWLPGWEAARALTCSAQRVPTRTTAYVGVRDGVRHGSAELPDEVVLHGDPPLVISSGGQAPDGCRALSVVCHGESPRGDLLGLAAERGVDLRPDVVFRLDTAGATEPSPSTALGWRGVATAVERARLSRPLPNLYLLGTDLLLGATVPYVAWQAAHVAEHIGKA
jgi:UDP-galactopyranose mutase